MSLKVPPIPKHLLPHTVQLKSPLYDDLMGGVQYIVTTLHHVRMIPEGKCRFHKQGIQNIRSGVLYYDAVYSTPKGIVPRLGDVILFDEKEYTVTEVEQRMAFQTLHHWKAVLT